MTKDRFIGCLMGLAIGDGLGAPVEGLDARLIHSQFGRAIGYVSNPPVEILHYTDDTQMTLGVAETLLRYGAIDEAEVPGEAIPMTGPQLTERLRKPVCER